MAGHIAATYFGEAVWILPFRFTAEAVIAFFLLSGFVIRWSTPDSISLADYALKRFRRIYPLYVISLGLGYLLASASLGHWAEARPWRLLGNLLMMQDFGYGRPGVWIDQYYNLVLWSLSYEIAFYAIFFITLKHRAANTAVAWGVGLFGFLSHYVWPNQISYFCIYFPVWWAGARMATAATNGEFTWRVPLVLAGGLVAGAALWLPALATAGWSQGAGLYPLIDIRRFLAAAVLLLVAVWVARSWDGWQGAVFRGTIGRFVSFGRYSYALYISHFPLVAASFVILAHWPAWFAIGIVALLAISLAFCLERGIQPIFNRLLAGPSEQGKKGMTPPAAFPKGPPFHQREHSESECKL